MAKTFFPTDGTNLTGFSADRKKFGMAALDSVDGLSQKNARMWQIIALVSLSSFFIALGILIYAVNLPKTVPVIVTVDSEGHANYAGKVDKSLYGRQAVPENAKYYQMKRLIKDMFTIVVDKDAQQEYIAEANSIVQKGAVQQLDLFFRENNPFKNFGEYVQSVEIQQPLRQTDKTYFINFAVTRKSPNGYAIFIENYTALVNIEFYESVPESNPLGIYITNFDIKLKK